MSYFVEEEGYSFDDVLIIPQNSSIVSRKNVDLFQKKVIGEIPLKIPIIASNMDTICGTKMAAKMGELGGLGIIHRYMSVGESLDTVDSWFVNSLNLIMISVGCVSRDQRRIDLLLHNFGSQKLGLCVDVAHGDSKNMTKTLDYIRNEKEFHGPIIAGNVCTSTGTDRLLRHGANIVKVGIGPGSACTTRTKTGCGYPQLTAIYNCAQAGPVIADGGIRGPADVAKAIAAGAKAVMIGGMLAGTDCTPNWEEDGEEIEFRGMASKEARESFDGTSSNAEGISCLVPRKGKDSTQRTVDWLTEGLRSAMSYVGATTLDSFRENTKFVKVTPSIIDENRPHILEKS